MIDQFRALSELPENGTKNANISLLPPSNTSPLKFEGRNCTSSSMVTSFLRGLLPSLIYCKVHKFPTQQTPPCPLEAKNAKTPFLDPMKSSLCAQCATRIFSSEIQRFLLTKFWKHHHYGAVKGAWAIKLKRFLDSPEISLFIHSYN